MRKLGELIVITGPMFAGKTTLLLKEVQKASKRRKAILFRSAIDDRYSTTEIVSHDGFRLPAVTLEKNEGCISALKAAAVEYDIIAIDEGQFWQGTKGFIEILDGLAYDSKLVYVAMLNTKADGNPFEISKQLMPLADRIYCLYSKCSKCSRRAICTQRVINGEASFGDEFVVGCSSIYEPRCRKHFTRPNKP